MPKRDFRPCLSSILSIWSFNFLKKLRINLLFPNHWRLEFDNLTCAVRSPSDQLSTIIVETCEFMSGYFSSIRTVRHSPSSSWSSLIISYVIQQFNKACYEQFLVKNISHQLIILVQRRHKCQEILVILPIWKGLILQQIE